MGPRLLGNVNEDGVRTEGRIKNLTHFRENKVKTFTTDTLKLEDI